MQLSAMFSLKLKLVYVILVRIPDHTGTRNFLLQWLVSRTGALIETWKISLWYVLKIYLVLYTLKSSKYVDSQLYIELCHLTN